ncbi:MAG: hypothetical protein HYT96_02740, partial [Armatimonadetes bacterium]|nr:hypothetical protein [Armatimonadota bacterium]
AENPSEKTIKWSELSTILWFVETCVTSKALFFDGTVPRETTEQALDEVEKLKRRYEVKQFEVSAIEFDDPRDTLSAASDALSESRLLLEHFKIDPGADKPVEPSEHENFFNQLNAARSLGQSERRDTALEWVADAFRGSKCLAALIENGDTALNAAYQLYERHAGQGPLVTGALINRFRLNYVNQLAAQKRSAYVPDPSFESLTKEHVRLFKDYLIERIIQKIRTQPEDFNILVENMKAETPLPPIGLYALMATRATNRPGAILETAYNEFRQNDALMRVIWKNTKGGIAVKKSTGNDDHGSEIVRDERGDRRASAP